MSVAIDLIVRSLQDNLNFAKMTLADMSDDELADRPSPASMPGTWQIGHCVNAEASIVRTFNPDFRPPAESFSGAFKSDKSPTPTLPGKAEVVAELERVRAAMIETVKTFPESKLLEPSPVRWAKTVGELCLMMSGHMTMHVGQIQVLRRKLGKPVLF